MFKLDGLELGMTELDGIGVGEIDGTGLAGTNGSPPRADLRTQVAHGTFHSPPDPLPGCAVSPKVVV